MRRFFAWERRFFSLLGEDPGSARTTPQKGLSKHTSTPIHNVNFRTLFAFLKKHPDRLQTSSNVIPMVPRHRGVIRKIVAGYGR